MTRPRSRAIIFANSDLTDPEAARAILRPDDLVVAADGGANHCLTLGLNPHVLIGDLDSVSPDRVAALEAAGTRILRYPARKNETDLELALDHAIAQGVTEIVILGALGGRWDQSLANVLLLAHGDGFSRAPEVPATNVRIRLIDGTQQIALLHGPATLHIGGDIGDTVSLIPVGGDADGVITDGLEYPLHAETLAFGGTRGISNVLTTTQATVSLAEGFLICVVIKTMETSN